MFSWDNCLIEIVGIEGRCPRWHYTSTGMLPTHIFNRRGETDYLCRAEAVAGPWPERSHTDSVIAMSRPVRKVEESHRSIVTASALIPQQTFLSKQKLSPGEKSLP